MSEFFCLADPGSDGLLAVSDFVLGGKDAVFEPCPVESGHQNCATPPDDSHLDGLINLEVKHNKRDQMLIWTWPPWPCVVVHEQLAVQMTSAGLSGFSLRPARVRFRDGSVTQEYKRLLVTGWGGVAHPESGIKLVKACRGCLLKSYSSLTDASKLIDPRQWSGEDFFVVWPLPYLVFITSRAADFFRFARAKSYALHSLDPGGGRFCGSSGFSVGSLADNFPRDLALKYGGPAGIL